MRTVILCEGTDDLWFLAYYLHKTTGWTMDKNGKSWKQNRPPVDKGQTIQYMKLEKAPEDTLAILAVDGETRFESKVNDLLALITAYPNDPIHAVVVLRDCDKRNQEVLAAEMGDWFSSFTSPPALSNSRISCLEREIDEVDVSLQVLPLVIPFDTEGAIETLLMNSIAGKGDEETRIVQEAKRYISTCESLTNYLTKQRERTKAEYSAVLAVTNPTRSRDEFQDLMFLTNWEESTYIQEHMKTLLALLQSENT